LNLRIANVKKYAKGAAPFIGIPIAGIGVLVFRRDHLRAALATEPSRIIYNADTKVVTFRTRRSEWKLNDLLGQGKVSRWDIQAQLSAWARGRRSGARKRNETKALGKKGVYVRRLREAVAKLTKQRDKIYLRRPVSPLIPVSRREANDYGRTQTSTWVAEKEIRMALAKLAARKLFHGEPSVWADFYRAVEAITGRLVSDQQKYGRVHACKRYRHGLPDYPDREAYLQNLPRYLVMMEKPWDYRPWDPYKKEEYGEQLNALESHAQARREYCVALHEWMALDRQIAAHLAEIASVMEAL
jgi:hypothetical protein